MPVPFIKMHGLGNDFVIIDSRENGFVPSQEFLLRVADRCRGVGCDQFMILLKPKDPSADLYMDMYNRDGSIVRACGNATRCVARLLFEETGKKEGVIQTITECLKVWQEDNGNVTVEFGAPKLDWQDIPLAKETDTLHVTFDGQDALVGCCVNVGNPHTIFFVPDVMSVPLDQIGPILEHDPIFPDRCNIEFAQLIDPEHIRMRVWERGTGITQACGSAALATLVAAVRRELSARKAVIQMDGGDLVIEWRETDGHITLSGSASKAFEGVLNDELIGES
ncbi:MAG: diaminopimelate epimerase [Bdellovibrionales bacterium]